MRWELVFRMDECPYVRYRIEFEAVDPGEWFDNYCRVNKIKGSWRWLAPVYSER